MESCWSAPAVLHLNVHRRQRGVSRLQDTCFTVQVSDPKCCDYDKRTPLHLAASEGSYKVAEWLLEQKADVNALDRFKRTPLEVPACAFFARAQELRHWAPLLLSPCTACPWITRCTHVAALRASVLGVSATGGMPRAMVRSCVPRQLVPVFQNAHNSRKCRLLVARRGTLLQGLSQPRLHDTSMCLQLCCTRLGAALCCPIPCVWEPWTPPCRGSPLP